MTFVFLSPACLAQSWLAHLYVISQVCARFVTFGPWKNTPDFYSSLCASALWQFHFVSFQ